MTRRNAAWFILGPRLFLRPAAAGDRSRLGAFLGRRDVLSSAYAPEAFSQGGVGPRTSGRRPGVGRGVRVLAAFDPLGAPAGVFALGPRRGDDLVFAFCAPSGAGQDLGEALRLVAALARARTKADRLLLGNPDRAPLLNAILVDLGWVRDPVEGWVLLLREGEPSPLRIVHAG